jgi:acyl-CoA reductase-like NAD-dependent aldehyde dehydrogenase
MGATKDGTRREAAAQLLEKIAAEIRADRHKAGLILSLTHSYLKNPLESDHQEIKVQAQALRELADDLERTWASKKREQEG